MANPLNRTVSDSFLAGSNENFDVPVFLQESDDNATIQQEVSADTEDHGSQAEQQTQFEVQNADNFSALPPATDNNTLWIRLEGQHSYLKTKIRLYANRMQTLHNPAADPRQTLSLVSQLRLTLESMRTQWEQLTVDRAQLAHTLGRTISVEEDFNTEESLSASLGFLDELRSYLQMEPSSLAVDPTFDNQQTQPNQSSANSGIDAARRHSTINENTTQTSFRIPMQASVTSAAAPDHPREPQAQPINSTQHTNWASQHLNEISQVDVNQELASSFADRLPFNMCKDIKLQKFNGDPKAYREFIDMFNTFVDKANLPELQKLMILRHSLTGRALNQVRHLQLVQESYATTKRILEETFGNKFMAEDSHLKEIDRILSSGGDIKIDKLPHFNNLITQHIYALTALGYNYDNLSLAFANRILTRLPVDSQHKFAVEFRDKHTRQNSTTPKLEVLLTFLREECIIIESLRLNTRDRNRPQQRFPGPPNAGPSQYNNPRQPYQQNANKQLALTYKDPSNAFHSSSVPPTQSSQTSRPQTPCIFCEELHAPYRCTAPLTYQERYERAVAAKVCLKCLKFGHEKAKCRRGPKQNCRICQGKHYSVMCKKANIDVNERTPRSSAANFGFQNEADTIYLRTAIVWAELGSIRILCRVLIDPGSQHSHITASLTSKLRSKAVDKTDLALGLLGGLIEHIEECDIHIISLRSRFDENKVIPLMATELKNITPSMLPRLHEDFGLSPIADQPVAGVSDRVEILIGSDHSYLVDGSRQATFQRIVANETVFGFVFNGSNRKDPITPSHNSLAFFCGYDSIQPGSKLPEPIEKLEIKPVVEPDIKKKKLSEEQIQTMTDIQCLWQSEELGLDDSEDNTNTLHAALIAHTKNTTTRDREGYYVLRLPFRENLRSLGDNEKLARSRLYSFLNKLKKDNSKLLAVDTEIQKYIEAGFAEEAQPKVPGKLAHYLPIQAVFKANPTPSEPWKTRIVKDASAHCNAQSSLNNVLHQGPNLLPEILRVLMKFRQFKYTLTCDVERAFLQFKIAVPDRTFMRFLWPLNISQDPNAKIREFWASRLDFGLVCSPFLHCQGVKNHLEAAMSIYPNDRPFLQEICSTFFMDDICFGADSIQEAHHKIELLFTIFQNAHFPLKKWGSNSIPLGEFIQKISPIEDVAVTVSDENSKFMGVPWNQLTDTLSVPCSKALTELTTGIPTKRKLLRGLALIFDPIGINCPTTISAKSLLQELWKQKIDWDTHLSGELLDQFFEFADLLKETQSIQLERWMADSTAVRRQVILYSDANTSAYGCVAYVREEFRKKTPRITFIMAKAKVVPVRPMSIHRLELLAGHLAAKIGSKLNRILDFKIDSTHYFSDNSSVLGWCRSSPEKWKPFVANRIRAIQKLIGDNHFYYIRSESNPADIITRSKNITDSKINSLWFKGPEELSEEKYPSISTETLQQSDFSPEVAKEVEIERKATETVCLISNDTSTPIGNIFFEDRFSSLHKAIRFWALMLRLIEKGRKAKERCANGDRITPSAKEETNSFDPDEMIEARNDLIRLIQKTYFKEEYESGCKTIKKSSVIYQFCPYMDDNQIIRCRTRLTRSKELSQNQKYPIILPGRDKLSQLIIRDIHVKKALHSGGMATTLHFLRKDYIVIHGRKHVRHVITSCQTCKIFNAPPANLPAPPLPPFRIERSSPYTHCGCDFIGPIKYKNPKGETQKAYILMFTCAVTRAIHCELTKDLSTYEVLLALQKFINRYPSVKTMISDNAASFRRCAKELRLLYKHIKNGEIKKWLGDSFITWSFNPPSAPWFGGHFERLVQVLKRCLRRVLGSYVPNYRDLEMILTSVEAMVNRRPITPATSSKDEITALSPADLMYGYSGNSTLPEPTSKPIKRADFDKIIFSRRWQYLQKIQNAFWKRFQDEYIQYLRTAHNRLPEESRPLRLGEVCLLHDKASSRAYWPLCKVIAFPEGSRPEQARSCTIKTSQGQVLIRPIKKLYPLTHSQQQQQ